MVVKKILLLIGCFAAGGLVALSYFLLRKGNPVRIMEVRSQVAQTNFSIDQAPKDAIRGEIATYSGTVNFQSRTATEPARLTGIVPIQQGESLVTGDDGSISVNFPSFGSVTLGLKSGIDVIQTLPVDFVFNQASGSGVYQNTGSSPFSIRGLHLLVTLASGSATVAVDQKTHLVTVLSKTSPLTLAFNDNQYISHVLNLVIGVKYTFDDDNRQEVVY